MVFAPKMESAPPADRSQPDKKRTIDADTEKLRKKILDEQAKNQLVNKFLRDYENYDKTDLEQFIDEEVALLEDKISRQAEQDRKSRDVSNVVELPNAAAIKQTEAELEQAILKAAAEKGIKIADIDVEEKLKTKAEQETKPEAVKKVAEEFEEKAEEEKKGFFASVKSSINKLRGKHWEKLGEEQSKEIKKELEELKGEAEEATEELKGQAEEIVESKESKMKAKLGKAREKFTKAKAKLKKFQGIMGSLRRLTKRQESMNAEVEAEEAKDKYLEQRAEYIADNVEMHLEESTALADAQADAFQKERGWGKKIYDGYKKLGEWNLTKLGIKPKSKFGKMIARAASVRTLVSAGLVVGGSALAAAGAASAAAGMFVARRAMGGLGAGIGSYDVMKMTADRKLGKEVDDEKLGEMNTEEIRQRLEYFESVGPMNGKKPSEIPFYNKLQAEYGNRLKASFESVEQAEEKGEKSKDELYVNALNETFEEQKEYYQSFIVKGLKLIIAVQAQKQRVKAAKPEDVEAEKKYEQRLRKELAKSGGERDKKMAKMLQEFMKQNKLFDNPVQALEKKGEDYILKSDFEKKLDKALHANEHLNTVVHEFAKALVNDTQEQMAAEKEKAQERADQVQKKLFELAKGDLNEVENRRKKARKNDAIMKGVAAGIGVFVGSGGVRWLMKEVGFVSDAKADTITGKQVKELGIVKEVPVEAEPVPKAVPTEEIVGEPMEIKPEVPIEAGTTIQKGDGMLKAMNRILAENPEMKSELGTPKEIRAWRVKQLKDMGFDMSGKTWKGPFTLEEGDKINILRTGDGSLKLQVEQIEKPMARVALTKQEYMDRVGNRAVREFIAMEEDAKMINKHVLEMIDEDASITEAEINKNLDDFIATDDYHKEMRGQMQRWFMGAESKSVPAPGLDEMIAARKAAQEAIETGARSPEVEAPSRGRAGIEAAEPEEAPKVAEAAPAEQSAAKPAPAEAAAEAVEGPVQTTFKGDNIRGGKIILKETPRGFTVKVDGQVMGMGADDYIGKGVLKENFMEELNRPSSTARAGALGRARTMYMYQEAMKSAKAQGNDRMVDALKRTIRSHKGSTKKIIGDIFS